MSGRISALLRHLNPRHSLSAAIGWLILGLALMVFPYFVSSNWMMVLVGAALMAIPYFVRL